MEDEFKEFTEIVTWPDSQMLEEKTGFLENCALINSERGIEEYGSCAYRVNPEWYNKFKNNELEDITAEELERWEEDFQVDWNFPFNNDEE